MDQDAVRRAFDLSASYYRYRLPYHDGFFEKLSAQLGLTGKERLLDLCCGNGAVMRGFTGRTAGMTGVDFSEEMLRHAPCLPDGRYLCASVERLSASPEEAEGPFDLVTIGHGIHWLDREHLGNILRDRLPAAGKIVILGNQWSDRTAWLPTLRRVEAAFRSFEVHDVDGRMKLGSLGFRQADRCTHLFGASCDLKFMENHLRSYARFSEKIARDPESFGRRLEEAFKPYLRADGSLEGVALNWALVYVKG